MQEYIEVVVQVIQLLFEEVVEEIDLAVGLLKNHLVVLVQEIGHHHRLINDYEADVAEGAQVEYVEAE